MRQERPLNCQYFIGIDCGVKTGLAVWYKPVRIFSLIKTYKIHEALKYVEEANTGFPGQIYVRVEDARLRKWIPPGKDDKAERGRREGAGSVKRDAIIWEDFLTDKGIPFEMVAPKDNKTKVSAAYFKQLTGYKEQTNEHERDAALLVFGY